MNELRKLLDELAKTITRNRSVNVNAQEIKEKVVAVSKVYFATYRPIFTNIADEHIINAIDETWQALIRLTFGNNSKASYLKSLKFLIKIAREIMVLDVTQVSQNNYQLDGDEKSILEILEALIPSAALSYRQAINDLNVCNHRLSYRGTAAELREALREVLDHLAPDADVTAQTGFTLEQNQKKPTMKQKVRFILKSRDQSDSRREPAEKSADLIEELSGQITRGIYNRASLSSHVTTTKKEVEKIKRYVETILFDILEIA